MCDVGDMFKSGDPIGGSFLADVAGLNGKKGRRKSKKTMKQIRRYNEFIRAGVDLQEELNPRLMALERDRQLDAAGTLAQVYRDTLGPASRELDAEANTAQRGADLSDLERYGAGYTEARLAAENADPREVQRKAYEDELLRAAMEQFGLGADMDPMELRKTQQLARMNRTGRGFGQGSENDLLYEALALLSRGEGLRQQRTGTALNVLTSTRREPVDPLLAVLGRPGSSLGFAAGAGSQAQSRLAPAFGPEQTYGSDLLNAHYADLFSRRNKAAADKQAEYSLYAAGIGALGSAAGGAGGLAALCWVAREVFGAQNPQWLQFRNWLLGMAPLWFVKLYILHGPEWAEWLKRHPWAKPPVRRWMESRIRSFNAQPANPYAVQSASL